MFDTHCHLNFERFENMVDVVISGAHANGINQMIIPGTDIKSSHRAVELAKSYDGIYAAVGIHPHHAVEISSADSADQLKSVISNIEKLLNEEKVVAVGEVGIDRHEYKNTKYTYYTVDEEFIAKQKEILIRQIILAIKYKKSLILHNREAKNDIILLLNTHWDNALEYRMVFHCCEPEEELLQFAKEHHIFIGVDGDVTYEAKKKEFVKHIPLDLLVLETDSPYLLPEPLRSQKKYPNVPSNITLIASYIADELHLRKEDIGKITTQNARRLFDLPEDKG